MLLQLQWCHWLKMNASWLCRKTYLHSGYPLVDIFKHMAGVPLCGQPNEHCFAYLTCRQKKNKKIPITDGHSWWCCWDDRVPGENHEQLSLHRWAVPSQCAISLPQQGILWKTQQQVQNQRCKNEVVNYKCRVCNIFTFINILIRAKNFKKCTANTMSMEDSFHGHCIGSAFFKNF